MNWFTVCWYIPEMTQHLRLRQHIGGTTENFVSMMNAYAASLGCTGTHFTNPHGLQDENHYTTPYDIYLMLKEALKYPEFTEITQLGSYTTSYKYSDGSDASVALTATDLILQEKQQHQRVSRSLEVKQERPAVQETVLPCCVRMNRKSICVHCNGCIHERTFVSGDDIRWNISILYSEDSPENLNKSRAVIF